MYKSISYWTAPRPQDTEAFERYYREVHTPLAARVPGAVRFEATLTSDGIGDTPPSFYRVAEVSYPDIETMQAATRTPEWADMLEDAAYIVARFHVDIQSALGSPLLVALRPGAPVPTAQERLRQSGGGK
jgi:uncharacterized protein (TIGR02118 family)